MEIDGNWQQYPGTVLVLYLYFLSCFSVYVPWYVRSTNTHSVSFLPFTPSCQSIFVNDRVRERGERKEYPPAGQIED